MLTWLKTAVDTSIVANTAFPASFLPLAIHLVRGRRGGMRRRAVVMLLPVVHDRRRREHQSARADLAHTADGGALGLQVLPAPLRAADSLRSKQSPK